MKKAEESQGKLHFVQKEVADKAPMTKSTYHVYKLEEHNPKPEPRQDCKALRARSEYLVRRSETATTRIYDSRDKDDFDYTRTK